MRWIVFVFVAGAFGFVQNDRAEKNPVLVRELNDNIRVRLVGARVSETRGRHLSALFETEEAEPTTIAIGFPSHSFTTHEQTLRAIIISSIYGNQPDKDGWTRVDKDVEVIFSIPKDGAKKEPGEFSALDKCYLVWFNIHESQ